MAHAQWAVDVRSADTGQQLFSLNAGKLMMPASNMKILTLAAAAEVLGWDSRMLRQRPLHRRRSGIRR
jgi:D-alanyl-D-alanine carboxypeptidase/D-alanyl-D-alanine-endopeptidase (penicillin-binding protein 4)